MHILAVLPDLFDVTTLISTSHCVLQSIEKEQAMKEQKQREHLPITLVILLGN